MMEEMTPAGATAGPAAVSAGARWGWAVPFLVALGVALIFVLACYWAAGAGLGLIFGGLGVATILGPPLAMGEGEWRGRLLALGGIVCAIGLVWLAIIPQADATVGEWAGSWLLVASYILALSGLAGALERIRVAPVAAAAIAVVVGLAWLTWPVWMAPWLRGPNREAVVGALVPAHPLLAANGALREVFPVPWAQHRIAYGLTNIGDDIAYELPRGVTACVLLHAGVGGMFVALSGVRRRRVRKWPTQPRDEVSDRERAAG